jgi:hypothetical protein
MAALAEAEEEHMALREPGPPKCFRITEEECPRRQFRGLPHVCMKDRDHEGACGCIACGIEINATNELKRPGRRP